MIRIIESTERIKDLLFAECQRKRGNYSLNQDAMIEYGDSSLFDPHYALLYYSELFPNDLTIGEYSRVEYVKRYGRSFAEKVYSEYRFYKGGMWHPNTDNVFNEDDLRYDREREDRMYPDSRNTNAI